MKDQLFEFIKQPAISHLLTFLGGALIVWILLSFFKKLIPKYVEAPESRYRFRKLINLIGYLIFALLLMMVYSNQLSGLTVFLGVAGAGIAFALQEVIASFAGFIAITTSKFYKIGDRVMLGGIKGDVVDISFLRTTVMQIGDWVSSDQYNGKIVRIANSFIFKEPVFNYSGDFPFVWDEIQIPIRTNSDYEYGKTTFLKILDEVQGDYARNAQKSWDKMTTKYMIEDAKLPPSVTMSFNENWITMTLRYVVDYQARSSTKDKIYGRLLDAIRISNGKLSIASTAMEVTNIPHEGDGNKKSQEA